MVKLKQHKEREKRIKNNSLFSKEEANFYRKECKNKESNIGNTPNIESFEEFWGEIWEDESRTANTRWME